MTSARTRVAVGGVCAVLAGTAMLVLTIPGGSPITYVAAGCGAVAVLSAQPWPVTGTPAVLATVVALAAGAPSPEQAAAAGVAAVMFLLASRSRELVTPHAVVWRRFVARAWLLLGAVVASAAALLGWVLPVWGRWGALLGVLAAPVAFALATLGYRVRAGGDTAR